jgi:hypothetical protein
MAPAEVPAPFVAAPALVLDLPPLPAVPPSEARPAAGSLDEQDRALSASSNAAAA